MGQASASSAASTGFQTQGNLTITPGASASQSWILIAFAVGVIALVALKLRRGK